MTSAPVNGVEHRQLKDSVYLKLRQEIVSAKLPPGYLLREAELAARFGVSKTPLREAFVRLEKDGFVEIAPYRSAVVGGYSRQDLREIYEVRELLEGLCAREAALNIATEDLAALSRIVRDSATAFEAGDSDRLAALLDEFDVLLYAQSKNSRITAMLNNIRDHVIRIGRLTVAIPGRMGTSVQEHQGIYDAIVQRDGQRAETLMRQHILSVMADQLANLDPQSAAIPPVSGHPDVLIIGAGAAGLFCALGLKDSASVTVVEAGPDPGTPPPRWMLYDYLLPDDCYYHYADADTGLDLPQGRGTGGGSTVNSAAALRGQPWDFDGWAVPGWSWLDCLDGFRAIESDQQFGDVEYHGSAGLIPITRLPPGPLDEALIALCAQRGYPATPDHNAPGALGIGVWPTNRKNEGRWGTHAAVLPLVRLTVDVRTGTQATRLLFDGTRCAGAEVVGPEGRQRLYADRVVVCAGAFGSSLLLMNSGVGPEAMVRHGGARLVSRLDGVGANLQDHPWCLLDVDVTDLAAIEARPVSGALLRYELPGDHVEAEIFPWQTRPYDPSVPATQVSFTAALMTPLSRGRVTLTPGGVAEVRVRHLEDDQDAARMAEIVATTGDMIDELAAQGLVRVPDGAWWRAGDLATAGRRVAGTYNHHCGTCRMGDPADLRSVVSPGLDVLGTTGLTVADCSVFPVIPRANTNLASMMIGYRAAQLLRA